MEPFTRLVGVAAPLLLPDIDTDVICPAHRPAGASRDPGDAAFGPLRYRSDGSEAPDFVLNQSRFRGAPILLCGPNFGCGSSREMAVWSLQALGVRCLVAPSFGDIFFANCFQNGVLPVVLPARTVEELAAAAADGSPFAVDLRRREIETPGGGRIAFDVNPLRRAQLLEGLDDIALTLTRRDEIAAFQAADRERRPWIYASPDGGPGVPTH